ncbi:MAG: hypothetical protein JW782_05050 [Candidatus Saganbacteria bacterium]|nr:hypothetical protein [Candidatus Saganbacteria bacterium]
MSIELMLAAVLGALGGAGLFSFIGRLFYRSVGLTAEERPAYSEKEIEELLRRAGYQIKARRAKETLMTVVNGKERFGQSIADLLVSRKGRNYVVCVHAGAGPADPNEPMLRRRLLELDRVFKPDGLLVLGSGRGEIQLVKFRFPREWNIDKFFRILIALFIIAVVIGIIWMLAILKLI